MPASAPDNRITSKVHLLRATALVGASRILGIPASIVIAGILTNNLTRSEYAFYGALNSLSLFFAVVAQLGYQTSIVRIMGHHQDDQKSGAASRDFRSAVVTTALCGTCLAAAFLLVGKGWLPDEGHYANLIYIMAAAALIFKAFNILSAETFRGLGRVGLAATFNGQGPEGGLLRAAISIFLLTVALKTGTFSLGAAICTSAAASAICSAIAFALLYRMLGPSQKEPATDPKPNSRFPANFDFMYAQLLQIACSGAAANIIGANVLEAATLAGFVAATQVLILLNAPLTLLNGAAPALLIKLHKEGNTKELAEILKIGASFAFLVGLCVSAAILSIGPGGFRAIFGDGYGDTYLYFAILVPGLIVSLFTGMSGRAILLLGSAQSHRNVMILAALIALPLYYLAARLWGTMGLTAALSFSLALQNIMLAIVANRELGMRTQASLDPRFYYAIAMQLIRKFKGKIR